MQWNTDIEILYNICLLCFDAVSLPLIKVQYLVVYKNFTLTVAQETSIEPGLAIGDRKKVGHLNKTREYDHMLTDG